MKNEEDVLIESCSCVGIAVYEKDKALEICNAEYTTQ